MDRVGTWTLAASLALLTLILVLYRYSDSGVEDEGGVRLAYCKVLTASQIYCYVLLPSCNSTVKQTLKFVTLINLYCALSACMCLFTRSMCMTSFYVSSIFCSYLSEQSVK